MEILLWLVPAGLTTVVAMLWVSWVGRDGHGEVDREVAVERLGKALAKDLPAGTRPTPASSRDRNTGIAVRPSHAHGRPGGDTRRAS
ncbi:hypothetical protein [Nocardioides okcheonensis]|uniref:hypothetical protein n=1 Tax=Nocardioides okcheonensis TaxID=2894081 RepID=UPI001E58E235|nr:hypothetical protein [Nocardioides okcheonensis]UFN44195.1 hypothetical protein LN652_19440 [Nocardioides okcheonensis]